MVPILSSSEVKSLMSRIVLTTIEHPGRVHIGLFEGHGEHEKAIRKELTLMEMADLHEKLTRALWHEMRYGNDELRKELRHIADKIASATVK
jgi:hypothetical protein